jgi:hypothetical protein
MAEPCDGCGHPKHLAHECPVTRYGDRCACDEPVGSLSREDAAARTQLYDVAVLVEQRWPGEYPTLCRDLRDLADTIGEESEAGDG